MEGVTFTTGIPDVGRIWPIWIKDLIPINASTGDY